MLTLGAMVLSAKVSFYGCPRGNPVPAISARSRPSGPVMRHCGRGQVPAGAWHRRHIAQWL